MIELIIAIILILVGLALLVKGADYLVDGAADIARWLKVSPILVGLTIVAFGTSLPEFVVSIFSVFFDKADISIGTIIGSNIANIGIGIGICALIAGLAMKSKTLIFEFPFLIVSSFLLLILASDFFIFREETFSLSRFDGLIFVVIFVIFMVYIYRSMKDYHQDVKKQFKEEYKHDNSLTKNILFIIMGLIALVGGGKLFIMGAEDLAFLVGVSEIFIGTAIAAIGTSLPDILVSVRAAWRGHGDIAVGNIIGSCIFNILFVLGIVSLIKPIVVNSGVLAIDGMVMALTALLFLLFATSSKRVGRKEGAILVLVYIAYFIFLVWRL